MSEIPVTKPPSSEGTASSSADVNEVTRSFQRWLEDYRLAAPERRKIIEREGIDLAQRRRKAIYSLIQTHPEEALRLQVRESDRRLLSPAVINELEQTVNARGELAAIVVESPGMGRFRPGEIYREARFGDEHYEAFVYGRRARQDTKYGASIIGVRIDDRMAVLDEPARVVAAAEVPAGARIGKPLLAGEHDKAGNGYYLQMAGEMHPVCCTEHAMQIIGQAIEGESGPGAYVTETVGSVGPQAAPVPPGSPGAHSVLVILTDYSDATGTPEDSSAPGNLMTSSYVGNKLTTEVSDFFAQSSYGKVSIGSVTVTSLLRMPGSLASYATTNNVTKMKSDALGLAASYNPSSFSHVIVAFANTDGIGGNQFVWTGLADVGGDFVWLKGNFSLRVVTHELQHNMGLRHANLWRIPGGSTNPVDPLGSSEEYGDSFDVMGSGPGDAATQAAVSNPWFLNRLHWLPDTAVQAISTSGTYRVYRYDHQSADTNKTLAIKLARNSSTDYWLGYRRKYAGHPSLGDVSLGAYLFWGHQDSSPSALIDVDTPGASAADASLNVGSTFNDTTAGVSFQVVAAGGSGTEEYLDMNITFQPRLSLGTPEVSVDEQAGTLTLTVQRTNNASGAVSAHYATANGTATAGSDYTATSGDLNWANGDTSTRSIVIPITPDAVAEGAETFTLTLSSVTGAAVPDGSVVTATIQESGAADPVYAPVALNSAVRDIVVQPDGRLLVGGGFSGGGGVTSAGITRLNGGGLLDPFFDQGTGVSASSLVQAVARQPNGKIIIAGTFSSVRNIAINRIARLNSDGTYDLSFDPGTGPNGAIVAVAIQPDGKVLVGGDFSTWNGVARPGLVRLLEDGSLDTSFVSLDNAVDAISGLGLTVAAIAMQPIGTAPHYRIIVGGTFQRPFSGGGFHSGIVAVSAVDGNRDSTFDAPLGAHAGAFNSLRGVESLAVQPDGKIIAGGQFTGFGGVAAGHIARLNASGSNDGSFISNLSGGLGGSEFNNPGYCTVTSIVVQGDGKIDVAGAFSTASANTQAGVARYNPSGTFDNSFRPAVTLGGALLSSTKVAIQADGRLLLGLNGAGDGNVLRRYFTSLSQPLSRVQFAATSASTAEGSDAVLTVERTGGSLGSISVNYSTVARSATAEADYTTATGTLTWADGDMTSRTITIATAADLLAAEPDETFDVCLGNPIGGMLMGENQTASVTILNADLASFAHISFASSGQSVSEAAGTVSIDITASPAPVGSVSVPVTITTSGATQGAGKDFIVTTSTPITFSAGETSKSVSVDILQDALREPAPESFTLTLGTPVGSAVLGGNISHTVQIVDDEALPTAAVDAPVVRILPVGGSTSFTVTAAGNPVPSIQWRKGVSAIAGQKSSTYTIGSVTVASAGSYNVLATSTLGTGTSGNADMGVIDKASKIINLKAGGTATISLSCSSNVNGFHWRKDGVLIEDIGGHRTGTHGKTLVLTKVVNASAGPPPVDSDAGVYSCDVSITTANGTASEISGNFTLNVIDGAPQWLGKPIASLPDGIVGGSYDQPISLSTTQNVLAASVTMVGQPPGLVLDTSSLASSGVVRIKGRPNPALLAEKKYKLIVRASNAVGSDEITPELTIKPLALGTAGTWTGMVNRESAVNLDLGGRVDLTVLSNGAFTGKLINGTQTHSFSNGLLVAAVGSTISTGQVVIKRTGNPKPADLTLSFTIDGATSLSTLLDVSDGAHTASGQMWRNVTPNPVLVNQLHTIGFDLSVPDTARPQGTSYASFTVAVSGKLTLAGKLADGVSLATAGHVGPNGEVLVHQMSSTLDTIIGVIKSTPGVAADFSDDVVSGSPSWSRKAQGATQRVYKNGFGATNLTAYGSRYLKPLATETVMGLAYTAGVTVFNARLTFTDGDFAGTAPDVDVLVKPGGAATVVGAKPRLTSLSIKPATAFFSGTFSCADANPFPLPATVSRNNNAFQGLIIRHGGGLKGRGYFLLPDLPSFAGEASNATPSKSGSVLFD